MGRRDMGALLICVDANYRTLDVRRWMASVKSPRLRAITGDTTSVKRSDRFRRTRIERTSDKRSATKGMVVWRVNTNVYKEQTFSAITAGCAGTKRLFALPSDVGKYGVQYLKQLMCEVKRKVVDAYGREKTEWVVRSVSIGNHHGDTEHYARAAADMKLEEMELDWDTGEWPTPKPVEQTASEDIVNYRERN